MSKDKYYTPTIKEFCVGFEYEYVAHSMMYLEDAVWDGKGEGLDFLFKHNTVQVKYLDREDIESLGFTKNTKRSNDRYQYFFASDDDIAYSLDYSFGEEDYWLDAGPQIIIQVGGVQRLNARIKNKSELKKVLEQIGYGV